MGGAREHIWTLGSCRWRDWLTQYSQIPAPQGWQGRGKLPLTDEDWILKSQLLPGMLLHRALPLESSVATPCWL